MIGIVGKGAIGRLWAASLPPGQSVFLDTRTENSEHGEILSYQVLDSLGNIALPLSQYELIPLQRCSPHRLDAVLICTKAYAATTAACILDKHLPKSVPFLLFQNGLGSQFEICDRILERPIYAASTTDGANIRTDDTLMLAGQGETHIGLLHGETVTNADASDTGKTHALEQLRSTPRTIREHDNIWPLLWRKLIINCAINPITAIENCTNGEIFETSTYRKHWSGLLSELSSLALIANLEMSEDDIEAAVHQVANATSANISSMLQDIRAKRPTEIKQINGFAVDLLTRSGYSATYNRLLMEQVNALGD
jgi:2-dehydropantoate 2-reductase